MIAVGAQRWLLAGAVVACVCAPRPAAAESATRARWLMGTLWTFTAESHDAAPAIDAALDTVASLERRLSNWSDASELSRLNAAGEGEVSDPLFAVLDSARALAETTDGAFDPTVEALTLAWDLRGEGRVPSASELSAARAGVGWRRLSLAGPHVTLGGTRLDLGGIAKGFALDRALSTLRARGVLSASLDAGGQRLLLGAEPCSVWVAHPVERDRASVLLVLGPGSLSTSAQSEHSLRRGGNRIGHVVDPQTGQPVATRASVSVFACSGTRADALSTALLVMGRERARRFATAHPELGVLWLEPEGTRIVAEAWNLAVVATAPFVTLLPSPSTPLARNRTNP
ncbi:MAG TPA: FAD:protein FMN transferase [Methylomirabilota bacterium]|nr:FAD:protein FMN transferase [Methylomirabilota bacterium]